jgi:hypothetical protein
MKECTIFGRDLEWLRHHPSITQHGLRKIMKNVNQDTHITDYPKWGCYLYVQPPTWSISINTLSGPTFLLVWHVRPYQELTLPPAYSHLSGAGPRRGCMKLTGTCSTYPNTSFSFLLISHKVTDDGTARAALTSAQQGHCFQVILP